MAQHHYGVQGQVTEVVTYRHAYLDVRFDLCAAHAQSMRNLGSIEHGTHSDSCDKCTRLEEERVRREERRQTEALKAAVRKPAIRLALGELAGMPVGAWGQTQQRYDAVRAAIPRDAPYTCEHLVSFALAVDERNYYVARPVLQA